MYIHRDIEKYLIRALKHFPSIVVTGPRQTGKSTMLKEIFNKTHNYASFDDPLVREKANSDPKGLLDSLGECFILDEIQYVPQITSYIKLMIDSKREKMGRFILTGSQQYHLIKNLGDSMAGRVAIFELMPFTIKEKRTIPGIKGKLTSTKNAFIHSCLRSSFPRPNVDPGVDINQWISGYFQTYLERDIKSIFDIGNLRDFQRFMQLLAARCSQILNMSSLSSDLGVAVNTIKKWISVLEASRIIYLLNPYFNNLGKRVTKSPKVYFLDAGLVCYLTGISNKDILLKGPLAGALFENFCIQETIKQAFNKNEHIQLYYLRTNNNLEVDLLIDKGGSLYPCEIKMTMTPRINDTLNISRLKNVFSSLSFKPGRIITLSDKTTHLKDDISCVSFDEYLEWV